MALINKEGNYLRVTGVSFDIPNGMYNIHYHIYPSQSIRQKYDTGLSEFDKYIMGIYNGAFNFETISNKDVKNALITNCYNVLKGDTFKEWSDC